MTKKPKPRRTRTSPFPAGTRCVLCRGELSPVECINRYSVCFTCLKRLQETSRETWTLQHPGEPYPT